MFVERFMSGEFDRLSDIFRWSQQFTFQKQNLAAHQYNVAILANAIAVELDFSETAKLQVLQYSLHHDFDEIWTGDIPHELKYNSNNGAKIRDELNSYIFVKASFEFDNEDVSASEREIGKIINHTDNFPNSIKNLVKVCDWLDMLWFCRREIMLGNSNFVQLHIYCFEILLRSIVLFEDVIEIDCPQIIDASVYNEQVFKSLIQKIKQI